MKLLSLLAAAIGGALVLSGCQTTQPTFPEPDARWSTRTGQLRYSNPERSVIGDVTVSRVGSNDFQLDFLTGPAVPLLRMKTSGEAMQAEGIFARGRWSGSAHRAGRLGSWATLRDAFAAVDLQKSADSAPDRHPAWKAQRESMGKGKERITIDYPKSNERFIFVLPR